MKTNIIKLLKLYRQNRKLFNKIATEDEQRITLDILVNGEVYITYNVLNLYGSDVISDILSYCRDSKLTVHLHYHAQNKKQFWNEFDKFDLSNLIIKFSDKLDIHRLRTSDFDNSIIIVEVSDSDIDNLKAMLGSMKLDSTIYLSLETSFLLTQMLKQKSKDFINMLDGLSCDYNVRYFNGDISTI